ncbi:hypothetical protein BD560DRAFT_441105 [Blakeslea trispora]|nr:hypothetical protein BD560DRAFT_441105 [Blakeslea trispora]
MSSSDNDNNINNNDEDVMYDTAEDNFSSASKQVEDVAIDFPHGINTYGQKWNEREAFWTNITFNVNQVDSQLTDVSVKTVRDFVRKEINRVYKEQETQSKQSDTLDRIDAYTQKCLDVYEKHSETKRKNAKDRSAEVDVIAERRLKETEIMEQVNRIRSYRKEDSRSQRVRQALRSVSRIIEIAEESVRSEHRFLTECLDRMEGFTNQIVQWNEKLLSSMKGTQQSHATMAQNQAAMTQNQAAMTQKQAVMLQSMNAFFLFMAEYRNVQAMDRKVLLDIQQSSLNNQQMLI